MWIVDGGWSIVDGQCEWVSVNVDWSMWMWIVDGQCRCSMVNVNVQC